MVIPELLMLMIPLLPAVYVESGVLLPEGVLTYDSMDTYEPSAAMVMVSVVTSVAGVEPLKLMIAVGLL
ncbi:MAG: hypothetical protein M0001_14900 [Treponema sp.]|nr:hypothetical protein [Treponema sp.]